MRTLSRSFVKITLAIVGLLLLSLPFLHIGLGAVLVSEASKPQDSLITSPVMTAKLGQAYPFKEYPAKNAVDIVLFDRSAGFNGYEIWTRFRFEKTEDFNAYRDAILSAPHIQTSQELKWSNPEAPPVTIKNQFNLDGLTTGTRATLWEGHFREWIFDPVRRQVLMAYTD